MVGAMGNYWELWGEYALVHFRWPYLEVDITDMHAAIRLFVILGRDGLYNCVFQVQSSHYITWLARKR